ERGAISSDDATEHYVQAVAERLASVVPFSPYPWTIRVRETDEFNAGNYGGGVILVNRGVIWRSGTEAQLAYVIAHEMGHQIKGHVSATRSKDRLAKILVGAGIAVARDPALAAVGGGIAARATLAGYSRQQEVEADRIGLNILNQAGYDPR